NLMLAGVQLSLVLSGSANLGLLAVWLPWLSYDQSLIADLSALAGAVLLLAFTRAFFAPCETFGRLSRLLLDAGMIALVLLMLVIGVTGLFWYSWVIHLAVLGATLSVPLIAVWQWRQGFRPARLVTLGMLFFNSAFAFFLPTLFGLDQLAPGWLVIGMYSVCTVAAVVLSVATAERQQLLGQRARRAETQAAASSAELRATAEFLATTSHEIRTPMNGVLGMTELLLGTSLSAKQRDYVETIHSSGNELLLLINEILDISKLESGQIELDEVQFDLGALIADCLDIFRVRAEQQRVELISLDRKSVV